MPIKKFYKGPKKGEISSNKKGKNPSDYWNIDRLFYWNKSNDPQIWSVPNVKSHHVEKTIHPCQFPIGLIEPLIKALTKKQLYLLKLHLILRLVFRAFKFLYRPLLIFIILRKLC